MHENPNNKNDMNNQIVILHNEVIIEPSSSVLDINDLRWQDQVNELIIDCQDNVGAVRREIISRLGSKGGEIGDIIIALGSAGAITAIVDIIKAWLARDKTRNLKLKKKIGKEIVEIELTSVGFRQSYIQEFLEGVIK